MPHTVLIVSHVDDAHLDRLTQELDQFHQPWIRFDPGDFPQQVTLRFEMGEAGMQQQLLSTHDLSIALEDIGSIWYRRPTPIRAPAHLPALQRTFIEREARAGLWGMLRTLNGLWVNHPDAIRAAAYKPRQLALAQHFGLAIPRTLITNDPAAFHHFYDACQGRVIYKLLGFPSYEVEDGAVASTLTSLVPPSLLPETDRLRATAHLFQEFISKICDIRVIIIGEQCFAIALYPLSDEARLDFRRDYRSLRYAVHPLPASVQQPLMALVAHYGLHYAAIDLLYTSEQQYLFLELNAVGQLGWLEEPTGLPLFHTLARSLALR